MPRYASGLSSCAEIPAAISAEICRALAAYVGDSAVAVRSSAPGEDSRHVSFAGLHESIVGVQGGRAVLDAVRTVWASLWSDAALLYRRELALDPRRSRMAVLVQEMKLADCSGVAFARDPRDPEADCAVVEAVPGQMCFARGRRGGPGPLDAEAIFW